MFGFSRLDWRYVHFARKRTIDVTFLCGFGKRDVQDAKNKLLVSHPMPTDKRWRTEILAFHIPRIGISAISNHMTRKQFTNQAHESRLSWAWRQFIHYITRVASHQITHSQLVDNFA